MKAISLWEPWATFMAMGAKANETRNWQTQYRGDLLICAATVKEDPPEVACHWMSVLAQSIQPGIKVPTKLRDVFDALPFGHAVAIVELYSISRAEAFSKGILPISEREADLGNYGPGRFVWQTRNLRRLVKPVPVKGKQGLFEGPDLSGAEFMPTPAEIDRLQRMKSSQGSTESHPTGKEGAQ